MADDADRRRGCLLGLAVGDAVGTTLEFRPPGTFEPINDMAGGGPFDLPAGHWTDDTSMALCLAESIVETGRLDPADQMRRYVRWWREGHLSSTGRCFDIGNTVRAALARFERTGDPISGSTDERSAGNGSIMRLAPVPLALTGRRDRGDVVAACRESSRTTHGERRCLNACGALGGMLHDALTGRPKPEIVGRDVTDAPRGTGFVVDSLAAATWAFATTDDYRACILAAANLGDDADTTAAVAGQLAGAFYGASGIPPDWLDRLHRRGEIADMADALRTVRLVD